MESDGGEPGNRTRFKAWPEEEGLCHSLYHKRNGGRGVLTNLGLPCCTNTFAIDDALSAAEEIGSGRCWMA